MQPVCDTLQICHRCIKCDISVYKRSVFLGTDVPYFWCENTICFYSVVYSLLVDDIIVIDSEVIVVRK